MWLAVPAVMLLATFDASACATGQLASEVIAGQWSLETNPEHMAVALLLHMHTTASVAM
eukprot:CAMPEP_0172760168 /NCGR_PEP_ID=MMETSP1074-20121228/169117_1 /TAXON_ID=2916 /ORGANISM="Ceratium fusus, Strain PA161109" /LENGTH=58 /DNA_ID=CAMNT_0013594097 /DNA_START=104 /DNA_END=278 /DNA_ORIENTATION=+